MAALGSPSRDAVKFGLALLGLVNPPDTKTLLLLGAHDEFTLYAAVALGNWSEGERDVFDLAQRVHGWGRVQAVQRLAGTNDAEIKRWMLLRGDRLALARYGRPSRTQAAWRPGVRSVRTMSSTGVNCTRTV